MAKTVNPESITLRGRASFPRLTHAEAVAFAAKSKFNANKPADQIEPTISLLIEPDQMDKLKDHILNVYLPFAEAQHKAGEKRNGALDAKRVKKVRELVESMDWEEQPPFIPVKFINEKYADQTPECVARVEVKGPKAADFALKARVENETQLRVPDPDLLSFPVLKPLNETNFEIYPGAYVAVTIRIYNYFSSNTIYGLGFGANAVVYMGNLDGERLGGGGAAVDEDDIFED